MVDRMWRHLGYTLDSPDGAHTSAISTLTVHVAEPISGLGGGVTGVCVSVPVLKQPSEDDILYT